MGLSDNLLSQFAKLTVGDKKTRSESTVMGTVKEYADSKYVQIDGSELLTPVASTTDAVEGDRVTVLIKDHTATITGNITSPSARLEHVKQIEADVGTLVAENVIITGKLTAYEAEIGKLTANDVTITGKLDAAVADINLLNANYVTINGKLTAAEAEIGILKTDKLSAKDADIKYANIDFANIGEAAIEKLFADSGIIKDMVMSEGYVTGELNGVTINGDLINANTLKADRLVVKGQDGIYYQLNVKGVKEGDVDENGIEIKQTDENSINGSSIQAKSITAGKIRVDDLVAFGATIGGFNIGTSSLYSGAKASVDNTTAGIYLDKEGQVAFGDSNNYIKWYKEDDEWKLKMAATEFEWTLSTGESVEEALAKTVVLTEEEFYQSASPTSLSGGSWSTTQPTWTEGKYIWRRTKNTYNKKDENGNPIFDYTPSETGVCITGNTGSQGDPGDPGDPGKGIKSVTKYYGVNNSKSVTPTAWDTEPVTTTETDKYLWTYEITEYTDGEKVPTTPIIIGTHGEKGETGDPGDPGISVTSVDIQYYLSSSSTSLIGGSWSINAPAWVNGKYMWSKTVITYSDTSTSESDPICITGEQGVTGKGVSSIVEKYYQSTSNTTQTGGSWSTSVPTWSDGKYVWTKSVITYTDDTSTETTPVCVTGGKGGTGKGIKSIAEKYAVSSSNSTAPSTWYDTMQTMTTTNKYLWNYEIITYTDNTTSETTKKVIGVYGSTGKGIKSIAEKYATSSSNSTAPTTWYDSVQTMTATNKYLWNYEIITYTDNTTSETDKRVIGVYGNTGKGISSTAITYQSSTSGTTTPTGTWSSSIPSVSAGSYLWTRTVITYTDSTTSTSYSVAKMGNTGKGVSSTAVTYQAGTSGTTAPTGTWSTTIPSVSAGQYLWTKTVITYTDSSTSTSYCVGMKGVTGNGVKSTAVTYQSSSSGTTAPTGNWSTSIPSVSQGYYLWTKTTITYTDNTTATSYSVGRMGSDGAPGKDGQMLYATCSTAASTQVKAATLSTGSITSLTAGVTVTVAFSNANTAAQPALNVDSKGGYWIKVNNVVPGTANPYYWEANTVLTFVFDGSYWVVTDTMTTHAKMANGGLIIGNYSSSGTLGNNVFIDADSVDVRGGSTVYASYGANLIELGKNSTSSVIKMCGGVASLYYGQDSVLGDKFVIDGPTLLDMTSDNLVRMYTDYNGNAGAYIMTASKGLYGSSGDGRIDLVAYTGSNNASVCLQNGSITMGAYGTDNSASITIDGKNSRVSITGTLNSSSSPLGLAYIDTLDANTIWVDNTAITDIVSGSSHYLQFSGASRYNFDASIYCDAGLRLGNKDTTGTTEVHLNTYWVDGKTHDIITRGTDGLSCSFGWAGDDNNASNTYLRGKVIKLRNSSGANISSDERLKKDFVDLNGWEAFFDALKPCAFKLKSGTSGRYHIGFKAQQVEEALTNNGLTTEDFAGFVRSKYILDEDDPAGSKVYADAGIDPGDDEYGLIYTEFTALNTYKIQQLEKRIAELEKLLNISN